VLYRFLQRYCKVKKSRVCPKCDSHDTIRIPGSVHPFGAGNNVSTGRTIFTSVKVSRYLCGTCGFSEEWIDSAEDIERIRQEYGKDQ
jgi:ribosomal protein S27AE